MGQQTEQAPANRDDLVTLGAVLYARKCRGERIDALERLSYFRLLFLRQRRAGHQLELTEYGGLLQRAMKPVPLPKYTPAEGYIARMRRVDPVVAEVLGPVFDAMFPRRAA